MSLTLNLLTFSKRENSTKVPSSAQISGGRELSVLLKDATSIYNPTFVLRTSDPNTFNYAYCPDFGKYYFIRDWVSDHDLWNCICEEDVLATFRSQIRSSSQYVLRAATRWNDNIVDALYPTNVNITYDMSEKIPIFTGFPEPGWIILEVVNSDNNPSMTSYYLMSGSQFVIFKEKLMGDIDWMEISASELSKELQKALINPVQYITDAYWIPYLPGPTLTQNNYFTYQDTIKIGWWELECGCYRLSHTHDGSLTTITENIWSIIKHPEAQTRGRYLNIQPYTFYTFWSQTFGKIPIDSNMLSAATALRVRVQGDFKGSVILTIETATNPAHRIIYLEKSVKVPIQVGQMTQDLAGAANSALQVGIGAVSFASGDFVGATLGTASGISSAVQSLTPKLASSGAQGSRTAAALDTDVGGYFQCEFHYQVQEDIQDRGKPLCEKVVLSTLAASTNSSGYVICADANIATTGTKQEDNQIISYLNGGLFIE